MARAAIDTDQMIGRRIRALRKLRGLSQAAVASRVGITAQQIQKYENGSNRVPGGRLAQLAQLLEATVGELVGDSLMRGQDESLILLSQDGAPRLLRAYSKIENRTLRTKLVALVEGIISMNDKEE